MRAAAAGGGTSVPPPALPPLHHVAACPLTPRPLTPLTGHSPPMRCSSDSARWSASASSSCTKSCQATSCRCWAGSWQSACAQPGRRQTRDPLCPPLPPVCPASTLQRSRGKAAAVRHCGHGLMVGQRCRRRCRRAAFKPAVCAPCIVRSPSVGVHHRAPPHTPVRCTSTDSPAAIARRVAGVARSSPRHAARTEARGV